MTTDRRVEQVKDLILQIFSDTKVPPEKTRALLEEIEEELQARLDALPSG